MLNSLITVTVNTITAHLKPTYSVLEACKYLGFHVPRFCYHELLSVAGNCRMCLVELQGGPKPVAACALPITNNMVVFLDTPLVQKARENVLEFLLLNHPLDCPICDQGGECDLQDQSKKFGLEKSRNFFFKRSVEDKNFNPGIRTIMTRCIHCTRCVRFSTEILGEEVLGTLLRGGHTEISNYSSKLLLSELSGNIIDLCPVGALTSKSYSFKARPWELRSIESVDISDSLGSNIYINYQYGTLIRVLPKFNKNINGSLISDSARFFFDALTSQRLYHYYSKLPIALSAVNTHAIAMKSIQTLCVQKKPLLFLVDDTLSLENFHLLKFCTFKYNVVVRSNSITSKSLNYYFSERFVDRSSHIQGKYVFLIGSNLKIESSILNSKLRARYLANNLKIFSLTGYNCYNYLTHFVNFNLNTFILFLEGKLKTFSSLLARFKNPYLIIGENLLSYRQLSYYSIFPLISALFPSSYKTYVRSRNNTEGRDSCFVKTCSKKSLINSGAVVALNLRETLQQYKILKPYSNSLFWVDTHGTVLTYKKSSFLLPLLPHFYENNIYVNLEARPQKARAVSFESKLASYYIKLRKFLKLILKNRVKIKFLASTYYLCHNPLIFDSISSVCFKNLFPQVYSKISLYPIKNSVEDSLFLSKFSFFSSTLANCSLEKRKNFLNFFK